LVFNSKTALVVVLGILSLAMATSGPVEPGIALRRRLIQKRQNALVRGLAVDRLFARPWTVVSSEN
jgi:hypothetical protein